MKKVLIIISALLLTVLAAVTTITAISLTATESTEENVCYIERGDNDAYYPTVAEAVDDAVDGEVIVMIADSVESEMIALGKKSLTIDGNSDKKYIIDSSSLTGENTSYQFYNAKGDGTQCVTVKNATLINAKGFWFRPMTLNIENCNITTNNGDALIVKDQTDGYYLHDVNIVNTTWTVGKSGNECHFATIGNKNDDCAGEINIDNSVINFYGNIEGDGNGCMFYCNTLGKMSVNIINNSTLNLLGRYGQEFFYLDEVKKYDDEYNYKILLDEGVEIIFGSQYASPAFTTSDDATVTDNGAVWKNASVSNANIRLPILSRADKTQIGWASGDKLYSADGQSVTIEGGAEFTPIFFSSEDFALVSGATIRYEDNAYGLRFSTNVSDGLYKMLGDNATYKTYLVPLTENETTPIGETEKDKLEFIHKVVHEDFAEGYTTFHAAAVMAPEGVSADRVFSMSLSAYSEITLSYDNIAEPITLVTDFDVTENTRSLSQVAYELEAEGRGNALTEYILSVHPYT